jgi:hypothetical protein
MANKPKRSGNPTVDMRPIARRGRSTTDEPAMSWRFEHVDLDGAWGWRTLKDADLKALRRELVALEKFTRRKLQVDGKLIAIPSEDLCSDAQRRLIDLELEEWEELWQLILRSGGQRKWRAWGRAEGAHFYLLWWDPGHTVCSRGPAKGRAKHR